MTSARSSGVNGSWLLVLEIRISWSCSRFCRVVAVKVNAGKTSRQEISLCIWNSVKSKRIQLLSGLEVWELRLLGRVMFFVEWSLKTGLLTVKSEGNFRDFFLLQWVVSLFTCNFIHFERSFQPRPQDLLAFQCPKARRRRERGWRNLVSTTFDRVTLSWRGPEAGACHYFEFSLFKQVKWKLLLVAHCRNFMTSFWYIPVYTKKEKVKFCAHTDCDLKSLVFQCLNNLSTQHKKKKNLFGTVKVSRLCFKRRTKVFARKE